MRLRSLFTFILLLLILGLPFLNLDLSSGSIPSDPELKLYFFTAANCPHCKEIRPYIMELLNRYPGLAIVEKDVWQNPDDLKLLVDLLKNSDGLPVSTPSIFIDDKVWVAVNIKDLSEVEKKVKSCLTDGCKDPLIEFEKKTGEIRFSAEKSIISEQNDFQVNLPLLGNLDVRTLSLPLLTVVLGLMDSLNPCAFFVLMFLLSLLIHAHSRLRMMVIGLVFVVCSGLIYFMFMAAWLNVFLATGGLQFITFFAGIVAMIIGSINVKDFFCFHKGVTLSMTNCAKSKLYERVRRIVQIDNYTTMLLGTAMLAVAANSYELLCTVGFPMIYTRILTLNSLSAWEYYSYLGLYNILYILPLLMIVIIFSLTFGSHKLTEREGQFLKLISGVMMLELGFVLLFWPNLMNNLTGMVMLLVFAFIIVFLAVGARNLYLHLKGQQ